MARGGGLGIWRRRNDRVQEVRYEVVGRERDEEPAKAKGLSVDLVLGK